MTFIAKEDGLYNNLTGVLEHPLNIFDIQVQRQSKVPSEPVEAGSFTTDSKLRESTRIVLTVIDGGIQLEQSAKRELYAELWGSLDVFTLVAMGTAYPGYTIELVEFNQNPSRTILFSQITFIEIRQVNSDTTQTARYANPSLNAQVKRGTVDTSPGNANVLRNQLQTP